MPHFPEDRDPVMRRLRDLERKVDGLYARNPLASATLDDEDGNRRINFGQLPSGAFGVEVFDAEGNTVLVIDETQSGLVIREPVTDDVVAQIGQVSVDGGNETGIAAHADGRFVFLATEERGLVTPPPQYEWRRIQNPVLVTDSTFATIWQSIPLFFTSDSVLVSLWVAADTGTTGEVRLELNTTAGLITSGVQSIPSGFSDYRKFRWDLSAAAGIEPGTQINAFVNAQVRRTSGTGNIYTFEPLPMLVRDRQTLNATPTGI